MCIGLFGEVVFFSVSAFGLFVCSFRVSARFLEPWCEVFGPSIRVQVYFLVLLYTTPAVFASDMRNSSILSVYRSLFSLYYCVMWSNAATNASVEVCAFQSIALFLYSATHSPLIH